MVFVIITDFFFNAGDIFNSTNNGYILENGK